MKKIIFLFIFLLSAASLLAIEYQGHYSSSIALVVGVNKYLLWPHLEYAAKDAKEFAALLKGMEFEVHLLTDEQATKANILGGLDTLMRISDKDSRIVFYFAGHGQTEDLPGGREQGYVVPVDADLYEWAKTMLSMKEINERIRKLQGKHILLAFDSCYSGLGLTRGIQIAPKPDPGYLDKMMRLRSIQVLTAGGRSEQAIEAEGHGLFTDHLLAALSGAADLNSDGFTTGTEIYATIRPSITQRSFNRQTPQFGYIEGEGDIIFQSAPRTKEQAFVTVRTKIPGLDVWINGNEVARRLEIGEHRLVSTSGPNNILVKKGGRTFYLKTVALSPAQNFDVEISSEESLPQKRQPFSMFTIANKNVKNYSNSVAYDLDGDGKEEIITAAGNSIYVFKIDGSILWKKEFPFGISMNLVDKFNSKPAIGVSAMDHDKIFSILLNSQGEEIWRNVRKIDKYYQGKPDGGGYLVKLADIDNDGREEIIAVTHAGYAWKPRGIIVYDQAGREIWRYLLGPSPSTLAVWNDGKGKSDIIVGSYSPGNGNQERHNNTDDRNAYVISIDSSGKTNWVRRFGTHFTAANVLLADLDGDGSQELYVYKWTAHEYRKDEGAVYKITRNGDIQNRFEIADSIHSIVAAKVSRAPHSLYAADKSGNIYKLDQDLRVLRKRGMNLQPIPLIMNLVGVRDYDGDGSEDILLYSYNRLQQGRNPRTDYGPKNKIFYSNMKYQILSNDLSKIIKDVSIAEEWDTWRGFHVAEVNRPPMPQYPFLVLSDKITIFNF